MRSTLGFGTGSNIFCSVTVTGTDTSTGGAASACCNSRTCAGGSRTYAYRYSRTGGDCRYTNRSTGRNDNLNSSGHYASGNCKSDCLHYDYSGIFIYSEL